MSELDAVAYKNGQKNNWRRTAWNLIKNHTSDRGNAIVLYLPGSTDLDAPEALRRGFQDDNLIAVERDIFVAKTLRDKKRNCINADLDAVMAAWPAHTPVSVVIADFQCGLTKPVINTLQSWAYNSAFSSASLLLNLQRGRENPKELEVVKQADLMLGPLGEHTSAVALTGNETDTDLADKNRGNLAFKALVMSLAVNWGEKTTEGLPTVSDEIMLLESGRFPTVSLPSYRSTPRSPWMDSILFLPKFLDIPGAVVLSETVKDTRRLISASLAVRTQRRGKGARPATIPKNGMVPASFYPDSYKFSYRQFQRVLRVIDIDQVCDRLSAVTSAI